MKEIIDIFDIEKTTIYKGEKYRVRDNGAILREPNPNKRKRKLDNVWKFYSSITADGYLNFSSNRVHQIVATAFHGENPTGNHVVDHIDTNRQNNRPENLRWVTRLENILLNERSLQSVIYLYGSIDAFIKDPSKPIRPHEKDTEWMRTVTPEEAENTLNNLTTWFKEGSVSKGGKLGEFIFRKINSENVSENYSNYILSKTPNAAQEKKFHNDKPNEFPCTPQGNNISSLLEYKDNLEKGKVFFRNHNGEYVVVKSGLSKDNNTLYVLTRANYKYDYDKPIPINEIDKEIEVDKLPHSLNYVEYDPEKHLFIHSRTSGFLALDYYESIFEKSIKS
ncbi:HNH endonuclease signature motif containing protein [Tenacibaculum sp. SG-28]|uniref:HNH endonuclease signature motif containing protein n=1 Tax=Tenacibaculum sp. SG-28 TaxID=754426 RepID=UPI000CF3A42E|nr:HNH endonuclease signature motif containing protein [Tenacibaculum sp. SG-28]PQJ23362.1 hypothetical protein BSU00_03990 [Tenacibaculum sp. SG-28]